MPRIPLPSLLFTAVVLTETAMAGRLVRPTGDLPVIQQVQLVFSAVSHHCLPVGGRREFYDSQGEPRGYQNYGVPHLVCDPLVTLYNPHPRPITLDRVRVRIWDPPVGFRFKKNDDFLRASFAAGSFAGLAQLQVNNESNAAARKSFTLSLSELRSGGQPGDPIVLQSGETRQFAPWIDESWTWGVETGGGYSSWQFFDWSGAADLTNRDKRTVNPMGVECVAEGIVPGSWDARAGFQWDWLASNTRPPATNYPFEQGSGWVAIRLADTFSVEARPQRIFPSGSDADFRISLLAHKVQDPTNDIYQEFSFDADAIIRCPGTDGVVRRMFAAGDILQTPADITPGGKTPFAVLTAVAKRNSLMDGNLETTGYFNGDEHYETRWDETTTFSISEVFGENQTYVRPADRPRAIECRRTTDGSFNLSIASSAGVSGWRVRGGVSPGAMDQDLTDEALVVPLPSHPAGARIDRVSVDTSELGDHYFIQLVKPSFSD